MGSTQRSGAPAKAECPKSDSFGAGPVISHPKARDEIRRVFYYTACAAGVLVFHAFAKKTQRTPAPEIELARKTFAGASRCIN